MTLFVLGTSNCIIRGSFVESLRALTHEAVENFSVGASPSLVGLFLLPRLQIMPGDVVLLDYLINDSGSMAHRMRTPADITLTLTTLVADIRTRGATPVMLILPTRRGDEGIPLGERVFRATAAMNFVHVLDVARLFVEAMADGTCEDRLLSDPFHMAVAVTPVVGALVLDAVALLRRVPQQRLDLPVAAMPTRTILATDLVAAAECIVRSSSVYAGAFLTLGETGALTLPLAPGESLIGLMINTGAPGGALHLTVGDRCTVKPLTIYWDAEHPEWFTAIFVDLETPFSGDGGPVVVTLASPDAGATERTSHLRTPLPGRGGAVEIEGFLVGAEPRTFRSSFAWPSCGGISLLDTLDRGLWLQRLRQASNDLHKLSTTR